MSAASSTSGLPATEGREKFKTDGMGWRDFGNSVASGALSGFAVKTVTAPFSRMTILLQVSGGLGSPQVQGGNSTAAAAGGAAAGAPVRPAGAVGPSLNPAAVVTPASTSTSAGSAGVTSTRSISTSLGSSYGGGVASVAGSSSSSSSCIPISRTFGAGAQQPPGIRQLALDVVRREGLSSFWKGNWTSIMHKAVLTGLNYGLFESMKDSLRPLWRTETDPGFLARSLAGFLASSVSLTVAYPFDLVRTRLACNPASYHLALPSGQQWLSVYRDVISADGHRALARGLPCTLICQGLNVGLNFGIYETLNVWMLRDDETRSSFGHSMLCGAVAGITASTLVQPLDLIRRNQQISCNHPVDKDLSIAGWFRRILHSGRGVKGFYRGLVPELVKVAPAVGLNFYIYEYLRQEIFGGRVNPR
ncbi:unnamed protein product [Amoebophrya sp. A25]|nr:unnamed protein product [Amoebophrya sp. A25]|eukprot:GSA25T00013552001.1